MSKNPLLSVSTLPNMAPPFDSIAPDHYLPAVESAIEEARANIDVIKSASDAPTFDTVIEALEIASERLSTVCGIFYNQLSAVGGDVLQELAEKIGPLNANFSSDIMLDDKLFQRVKAVYDNQSNEDLTNEQIKLLDETYTGFVRAGANLDDTQKQRIREINEQMSVLGPTFMNNSKKSSEKFELFLKEEDLAGLPDSAKNSAAHAANEKGRNGEFLFTLDYPSMGPFLQYADSRDLREKVWRANSSKAWGDEFDNSENIKTIIKLRAERAKIMGYETYADFVLERRMAKNSETVFAFLERLKKPYKDAAEKDLERLKDYAKDRDGLDDLQPWDVGYYAEKLKQKLFDFTSEDFRPYFPIDKVLDGTFEHFSKLFGLTFTSADDEYPVWHKDVRAYNVTDTQSGDFVGTFYADFHPRPGKKDGAWMTAYRSQGLHHGEVRRPVIAIVCNFTKPTPDRPSLLTHGEVTTLFHEMGHAIHGLLSDVRYESLAGTSVRWDFVELPSQLQENWCYERETLDLLSGHYETGAKIPQDLIDKLTAAKNFLNGLFNLRQIGLGTLDMGWHTANLEDIDDVAAFEDSLLEDISLFPRLAGPTSTSFNHIFAGGYAAGYYSYKWAEVLEADTFELFLEKGLYDPDTASSYRINILSRGGTEEPDVLYRNFRGRDADPDALLRREGLLKDGEKAA